MLSRNDDIRFAEVECGKWGLRGSQGPDPEGPSV